ncbi:MAG TPA: hypothetical protein ENJ79_08435, partial [Gammaproteobacteria bacterium]|nr:hypothetical protein [Gammaproteobacteria bacterium]
YADVGFEAVIDDETDVDIYSLTADASFGIFDMFSLRAGFGRGNTDDIPGDNLDITTFTYGGQGHYSVAKKLDLFGEVLGYFTELNSNATTRSDVGFIYTAGVRFQAAKKFEIDAEYSYTSGDVDDDSIALAGILKFTRAFSGRVEVSYIDSDTLGYFAGLRLNF